VISLHKEHRIVGKLIGCPAKTPHQSVADGLPLVLSAPEITELVSEGVITTVTDSSRTSDWIPRPLDGHAIRTLKDQYDRYREESFQGQVPAYREKRKREILANAERFLEGKKRKITNQQETLPHLQDIADDKKEVDVTQIPTTSTVAQIEHQRRDEFIRRQISNIKELTPEYAKIQTFYEEPFLPAEGSVTQIDWESIQFGPLDQLKSATFHELRKRGFFVTSGDKFGGDFLAYPGDPLLFHAKFVVICHLPSKPPPTHPNFYSSTSDPHQKRRSEREQEALQVARCRLGTAVNKTVLISTFRDATSKVKFTELRWTAAATVSAHESAHIAGVSRGVSASTMQNNEKNTPPQLTT